VRRHFLLLFRSSLQSFAFRMGEDDDGACMRLITYASGPNGLPRLGVRVGHRVLDVEAGSRVDGEPLPSSMKGLLREGRGALSRVQALAKAAQSSAGRFAAAMLEEKAIRFLPPVPDPDRFPGVGRNYRSTADPPRGDAIATRMATT
jgi:hypothetical protein